MCASLVMSAGFLEALNGVHGLHQVRPPHQALDPSDFSESFFNYERVSLQRYSLSSLGVTDLPVGPTSCCPICADVKGVCEIALHCLAALQHASVSHSHSHSPLTHPHPHTCHTSHTCRWTSLHCHTVWGCSDRAQPLHQLWHRDKAHRAAHPQLLWGARSAGAASGQLRPAQPQGHQGHGTAARGGRGGGGEG